MTPDGGGGVDAAGGAAAGAVGRGGGGAMGNLSLKETLHVGDVVLIHCNLDDISLGSKSTGRSSGERAYVRATGLTGQANALKVENTFHQDPRYDVREFLFVVVDQLSYTAQQDMHRMVRHLKETSGEGDRGRGSATVSGAAAQLQALQARAEAEAGRNVAVAERRSQKPLVYGSIIQLRHLRTKQYLSVAAAKHAPLQKTSRRIELRAGSNSSWFRVNPRFAHKVQGEPVPLNEAVNLESAKLADTWNLNWAKCKNRARDQVFEINCARGGEGFGFELYSRALSLELDRPVAALSFGAPFCAYMPHFGGHVTASASAEKKSPYLRMAPSDHHSARINSKTIWILELLSTEVNNLGIQFNQTNVLMRHFASGRYLALRSSDLQDEGHVLERDQGLQMPPSPTAKSSARRPPTPGNARRSAGPALDGDGAATHPITAELVVVPGLASMLVLEPDSQFRVTGGQFVGAKYYVPADSPAVLLRWDHSVKGMPMWLACIGQSKGLRDSVEIFWSPTRTYSNVMRFDLVPEGSMVQHDAVLEHRLFLRNLLSYFERSAKDERCALYLYTHVDKALCDMIDFLADSPSWRSRDPMVQAQDALHISWRATPERQVLVRELRYVDLSFELLFELRRHTPGMMNEINFARRQTMKEEEEQMTKLKSNPGTSLAELADSNEQTDIHQLQVRCLKLVTRMWAFCFWSNRNEEKHFYRRGWMHIIDSLNGYGVGASDVFVALVADNPVLVRCVGDKTMTRFINFIRVLGPLDTWLSFLLALCAPQGVALAARQQDVLCNMVYAGLKGIDPSKKAVAMRNKEELLVTMRLDDPIGMPLLAHGGSISAGGSTGDGGVLGRKVLSQGIHDIGISWVYPHTWEVGKEVLFHGPDHLKLPRLQSQGRGDRRAWVSLLQVVWPLQPERSCEHATGMTWAEMQSKWSSEVETDFRKRLSKTGTHQVVTEQLKQLGKYILAQLRLMAGLTTERQMNCIMALQDEYSCSLCLSGAADIRLPSSIRGAFFDLLTDLWVDRHPHIQIVVPRLFRCLPERRDAPPQEPPSFRLETEEVPDTWSAEHLRNLSEEVRDFYRLKTADKMEAIVHAVRRHLCAGPEVEQLVHSAADDNRLMSALLRNLGFLIRYGFVSRSMMLDLLGPLLRSLDGRTDFLEHTGGAGAVAGGTGGLGPGGAGSEELLHPEITPLLQSRNGALQETGRVRFARSRFPPLQDSSRRYVGTTENKPIMQAKVQMANVLYQIVQGGMESKIAHIVQRFYMLQGSASTGDMVDEVLHVLDSPTGTFAQDRIQWPKVMLLDLAMYDHPELFGKSLELLFEHSFQTTELLDTLSKVNLMAAEQRELSLKLHRDVSQLGKLLYSFENWGMEDAFSGVDSQKLMLFSNICKDIRNFCQFGCEGVANTHVQGLLCQTEFFSHVSYSLTLDPKDFHVNCRPLLAKVIAHMCGAGSAFVQNNHVNQTMMLEELPHAEHLFDEQPECALLAAALFRNNSELCQRVPEALIHQFGDLIQRERRAGHYVPWFLNFMCAILVVGANPVPRNQVLVCETVKRLTPKSMLRLGKEMSAKNILELAARFTSNDYFLNPQPSNWKAQDGELIYYCCCVELCGGLAFGRSNEGLALKPFVTSLFPVANALRLLLAVELPQNCSGAFSIYRFLRTKWLWLLNLVFYDVTRDLMEADMLGSPLHLEFLGRLLLWLTELIGLPRPPDHDGVPKGGPGPSSGAWQPNEVSDLEDEYLETMLRCVDSLFEGPVPSLRAEGLLQDMAPVFHRFHQYFSIPVRASLDKTHQFRAWEILQVAAHRVAAAMGDPSAGMKRMSPPPRSSSGHFSARGATSAAAVFGGVQSEWDLMLAAMKGDARIRMRLEREEQEIGSTLSSIGEFSDPEEAYYSKALPVDPTGELPPQWDFRRGKIEVEDMLKRWVKHIHSNLRDDLPSLRRVLRCLLLMLKDARISEDRSVLPSLQGRFVDAGVTQMCAKVLDARLATDVSDSSWRLLSALLQGHDRVNKSVQQGLHNSITNMDDSGLFQTFYEEMESVGQLTKRIRELKAMPSLASWEKEKIQEYNSHLASADITLRAMRLMVEGHFAAMQDYFFNQVGNSRSVNVLETAVSLLDRICKDAQAADLTDETEVDCVEGVLALLIEVAQGPNLRNQEHLSTLGLVEVVFKLLSASFAQLQFGAGDLYPSHVRRLKSSLLQVLLALLEGRQDKRIHMTMISRVDLQVVRERIIFVYVYFVLGTRDVSSGKVQSDGNVAIPLDGKSQRFLAPGVHPTELFVEVDEADDLALDLLEDLADDELDELFSEGLDMLQLMLELSPLSREFSEEVLPRAIHFVDEPTEYASEREYLKLRTEYHKAEVYRMCYEFQMRFVRTIEVVIEGHLQSLHFQQPLTAMFYTQNASKQHILDTVPFGSPDIKAKAFIQMCQEVHKESKLIRQLSKFSIFTGSTKRWAQLKLPDGAHRPFQVFLTDDAWRMQYLLKLALADGILLGAHIGMFLIPSNPKSKERGHLVWTSELAADASVAMGALYCIFTVIWLAITACIKIPLRAHMVPKDHRSRWRSLRRLNAMCLLFREPSFAWRVLLLMCATLALVSEQDWIYAFLSADCFYQSPRLATVLTGVTGPLRSLAMTSLGALIISFAYAAVGFHYFREEFGAYCQESVIICTQNIIYQSTRNGIIGLSSMMIKVMPDDEMWTWRVLYDVSFFLVTGIMLLNTVVALIVDSFSAQRRAAQARETNQETETFISCIDRKLIETVAANAGISNGFQFHETYKQPKWDYMAFIFYLREKDTTDYTGPEQIIRGLVEAMDVKWMPLGRSKMLEDDKLMIQEDTLSKIDKQSFAIMKELEGSASVKQIIVSSLGSMNSSVNERLENFSQQMATLESSLTAMQPAQPAAVSAFRGSVRALAGLGSDEDAPGALHSISSLLSG